MEKEFKSLSEKIEYSPLTHAIPVGNIKEFIKKIKENSTEIHDCNEKCKGQGACQINESLIIRKDVLDKLAGPKLIDKPIHIVGLN